MSGSITIEALEAELERRGLIGTKGPAAVPDGGEDRPWYIALVLGAAGWLAGVFALLFVAILFEPDTSADFAVAGVVLLAAGIGLYAADRGSAFLDQLALAASIAGQVALTWAAAQATESVAGTAGLVALMQAVLLWAVRNRLAKTLAAFFACVAWAVAIRFAWWGEASFGSGRLEVSLAPALIGWLVIWVPIAVLTHALTAFEPLWMASGWRGVARPAASGLIVSLAFATVVSEPFAGLTFWAPPAAARNWLALWPLLAAAAALFAATCAFRLRNRALVGAAAAGALLHVAQFYYLLGVPLLIKSAIMIAVGAALLFAAARVRSRRFQSEGNAR